MLQFNGTGAQTLEVASDGKMYPVLRRMIGTAGGATLSFESSDCTGQAYGFSAREVVQGYLGSGTVGIYQASGSYTSVALRSQRSEGPCEAITLNVSAYPLTLLAVLPADVGPLLLDPRTP